MEALIDGMLVDVERFHKEVLHHPPAREPGPLQDQEEEDLRKCLDEELEEFDGAITVEGQADALIDLVYFALGGLLRMGLPPGAAFAKVHAANMAKERGRNPHREKQHVDAVKPEGWEAPRLDAFLRATPDDVAQAVLNPSLFRAALEKRIEKGKQYNQAGVSIEDYFPLGHTSYTQMVHLKAKRLVAEVGANSGNNSLNPSYRGSAVDPTEVAEHLVDMTNYASFYYEWMVEEGLLL